MQVTTIIEQVRRTFGISRDEYALLEYIHARSAHPNNRRAGWCDDDKDSIAEWVGLSRPGLYGMAKKLQKMELLEMDNVSNWRVTAKFIDEKCKESLQEGVKKVYTDCKETLQGGVNKLYTDVKKVYTGEPDTLINYNYIEYNNKEKESASAQEKIQPQKIEINESEKNGISTFRVENPIPPQVPAAPPAPFEMPGPTVYPEWATESERALRAQMALAAAEGGPTDWLNEIKEDKGGFKKEYLTRLSGVVLTEEKYQDFVSQFWAYFNGTTQTYGRKDFIQHFLNKTAGLLNTGKQAQKAQSRPQFKPGSGRATIQNPAHIPADYQYKPQPF